mmetsp:Transcript_50766/g.83105  ORF Transcript_50766/g.83105 Transcript_50766/m.83105 type:complete len:217 (-) Transcript_50766:191-841(-)
MSTLPSRPIANAVGCRKGRRSTSITAATVRTGPSERAVHRKEPSGAGNNRKGRRSTSVPAAGAGNNRIWRSERVFRPSDLPAIASECAASCTLGLTVRSKSSTTQLHPTATPSGTAAPGVAAPCAVVRAVNPAGQAVVHTVTANPSRTGSSGARSPPVMRTSAPRQSAMPAWLHTVCSSGSMQVATAARSKAMGNRMVLVVVASAVGDWPAQDSGP